MTRPRLTAARVSMHAVLLTAAAVFLFPFVWIALAAFKSQITLLVGKIVFTPVLSNFKELLASKTSHFLENFGNSLIVGSCSTALVLVAGSLAAYSLHRMRWPAWFTHGLLLWAAIFHMLPPITMVGAWFYMFRTVGLDNTYLGLILAHVTLNLPLAIWLLTVYVQEVPREIEEAAWVDGASTPVIISRIILPLIAPGLMAAAILIFIFSWNEFAVAVNLTQNETQTVPVAIAKFAQEHEVKYAAMAAGSTLSLIPALLLLLVGQRFIVRGLVAGAIK